MLLRVLFLSALFHSISLHSNSVHMFGYSHLSIKGLRLQGSNPKQPLVSYHHLRVTLDPFSIFIAFYQLYRRLKDLRRR